MIMLRELLVLLMVLGMAAVSEAVLCDRTTCASFRCGVPRCPEGFVIKEKGGFCGCCDNCVQALKEGDACNPESLIGGYPYHRGVTNSDPMCGAGLRCDPDTSVCIPKKKRHTTSTSPPTPPEPAGK